MVAAGGALLLTLVAAEVAARIVVHWRISPEQITAWTAHSLIKGRYTCHPYLPYVPTPGYEYHNSLGFKGKEFTPQKQPGVLRIVCMGGSTTYGQYVSDKEAYGAQLEEMLNAAGIKSEVINAGIPGYVSTETLVNLQLRVLPLEPDIVIFYEGRNDLMPQSYNNFLPDYSHWRSAAYSRKDTNYLYKPLFRASYLLMILATYKGDRLGWSSLGEHPHYGAVRDDNSPSPAEVVANLADPVRKQTYRNNVQAMAGICEARGIQFVLATMAIRPEKFRLDLPAGDPAYAAMGAGMDCNNDIVRAVAKQFDVPLIETAVLAKEPDLFLDDCHCGPEGHRRRAAIVFPVIAQLAKSGT
jgi:lysophospholipase L1-like esterase